jgi:hypothetical protein
MRDTAPRQFDGGRPAGEISFEAAERLGPLAWSGAQPMVIVPAAAS